VLASTLLGVVPLGGKVIDGWKYRHPLPHNQDLWKVVHGGGTWVMAGSGGVLTTSSDLASWTSSFYPDMISLDGLIHVDGQFLASGGNGRILISPDGITWTERPTGADKGLLSVAHGNGRYVLVGEDGTTATSTDTANWTLGDTGDDNWYFGVAYGNGVFVAVSFDWAFGFETGSIATSTDGINWTPVNAPVGFPEYVEFYDVSYADGKFVASGYFSEQTGVDTYRWGIFIATSPDGQTWTRSTSGVPETSDDADTTTPIYLNMIRHDAALGLWLGVGDRSVLMTSPDAENWTATFPLGNSSTDFYGIGFSPEGRVMVGSRGDIYFNANGSPDWVRKFTGNYTSNSDIGYNGSLYVVTGSTILTSPDGVDWTLRSGGQPGGTLANVAHGQGRWVAGSRYPPSQIPLTTSADGLGWEIPPTLPDGFTGCQDLAFGNGVFVALPQSGSYSIITSTDGLTWTGRNHPWFDGKLLRCYITFGDGTFLAYSTNTSTVEVATSTNGIDWTTTATGLTGTYYEGAFGGGRWVLAGTNGAVATSTDGVNWSEQVISFGPEPAVHLRGVAHGKDHWVICGDDKSIWSSEDGTNWTPAFRPGFFGDFNSVLFDGLAFWTVGNFGDIVKSAPLLGPVTLAIRPSPVAGNVLLEIEGTPGDYWNILTSPSLSAPSWSVLTTIDLESGSATWSDAAASSKFYLLSPPD
jgi:hypothetical protein